MFACFFFLEEDGIRDTSVTGVQTCALPIYGGPRNGPPYPPTPGAPRRSRGTPRYSNRLLQTPRVERAEIHRRGGRSEERRVGKEWLECGPAPSQQKTIAEIEELKSIPYLTG